MQQQRASPRTSMEAKEEGDPGPSGPPTRGRPTSKLKVLGRSHAVHEQSPPREPSSAAAAAGAGDPPPLQSPPTVVLSPSPPDEERCAISGSASPNTLVATPNSRCSPLCDNPGAYERLHPVEGELPPSPKYVNAKGGGGAGGGTSMQLNKSSQVGSRSKKYCECQNQNCIKCLKERGGNNNNHSNAVNNMGSPNTLYPGKNRGKLRQQSSSQTSLSFDSSTGNSPCLSRDNSADYYTDTTGVDLEQFIPDTINRNPKDRALMLRIEEELIGLVNDKFQTHYKFPPMTSYHRMLVHRCAAYFGMDHNIDQSGKCIVVNKTKNTRIPDVRFKEHIKEMFNDDPPRRSILKRDSNSIEDYCFKSPERGGYGLDGRRSKSFEEREEEYERARRRIFRGDMHDSSEDFGWSEIQWSSTDSDYARYRLHPPEIQSRQLRKLLKVHSEETEQSMRPCVAKSYSFGGYGGSVSILTRGDSVMSTHSAPGPRLLTKQDSGASSVSWRLSPSSSGYKSQSQMSESVTPSPTSTPHPAGEGEEPYNRGYINKGSNHVVWAVTDLNNVPKGSIIINPETGKPYKNEDGTIYYYDPIKPAPGILAVDLPTSRSTEKLEESRTIEKEKAPVLSSSSPIHEKTSSSKQSPSKVKSSFTNTATSPSLPFSPPLSTSSSVINSCDSASNLPQPHYQNYPNVSSEGAMPTVYPQPYIVYTASPYTHMPIQQSYDARMDQPSMADIGTTYYMQEGGGPATAQPIAYQTTPSGPYWNQSATPVNFYAAAGPPASQTPPHQRYSVQVPPQGQTAYVPAGYPATVNYVTAPPGPSHQSQTPPEMMPVYPNHHHHHHQPVQMVYQPNPPGAATAAAATVLYPNQPSLIYTNNSAIYPTTGYGTQSISYPQGGTLTPSGTSSVPITPFDTATPNGFVQLTHGMQQMNLGGTNQAGNPRGFVPVNAKCMTSFDTAMRRNSLAKQQSHYGGGNVGTASKQSQRPPPFVIGGAGGGMSMGQSHSGSTGGTNSPAGTVVAPGYCPAHQYQTPPPSTPPTPQFIFSQPGYGPRLIRQMSGERGPTPGTAKSSRSPTPASDVTHLERQRFTFPPNIYHGMPMPYIVQYPRLVGRGQPNVYRQPTPPIVQNRPPFTFHQGFYNNQKNRKPKVTKPNSLPPTGK
ncbi:cAMP-regulated phosphoprotein 21 isoform X2 [Anthonomus grandis grandis]|uniref:cAMP-regulated phosphoprotein 21 isoform X2 n=1 Tax=Anthonomus grandis grandis TaxID=2921223 RepID=UPI002164F87B|nr:cAMP-regulated phosphoprotein 21 isoform X2 [Anthonomus grandis grandis]